MLACDELAAEYTRSKPRSIGAVKECPLCRACADDAAERCPDDGRVLEPSIPGSRLLDGKYALELRLGEGGMGVVYRARHINLHRHVAIKVIADPRTEFAARFRIEAAALGRLKHPHIVDVMDFGVDEARGIAYLVMELLDGETLLARCESGPLERSEALAILEKVADAVDFAHERGILHRDLKPANVFLVRTQENESVKIVDFGLAQFLNRDAHEGRREHSATNESSRWTGTASHSGTMLVQTRSRSPLDTRGDLLELQRAEHDILMGTQAYMAPELFQLEPATRASDLYALGVMSYQMFTGVLPIATATAAVRAPSTVSRRRAPFELDEPVMRLLEADASSRPQSARDAIEAIRAGDRAAGIREWREREHPRRRAIAIVLCIMAVLGGSLWTASPIDRVERSIIDARFAMVSSNPNPAILLVVLDDTSIDADARPLALRADEFGATVNRMFDAGARGVAVDLLLPQAWASSPQFADAIVRHADRLTLSAISTDAGTVIGPECLPGLVSTLLGAEKSRTLFGFVNLDADSDGVTRHVRLHYRNADGQLQPTWSARVASTAGASIAMRPDHDRIDYTAEGSRFARVSWRDVPRLADNAPETFRDRVVLVGGEFTGAGDEHGLPPGRSDGAARSVSGLVIQAFAVNTILNGFPVRESSRWPVAGGAGLACGALAFLILTRRRLLPLLTIAVTLGVLYVAGAFAVFASQRILWPVAGPIAFVLVASAAAYLMRVWWGAPPAEVVQP